MTRLFIENQELDLNAEITAQLNYAVDDLINLDSKSASYSKTIVIPGSSNNNALFGNIFEFTNSNFPDDTQPNVYYNFNASKSAEARIEINGMPAMKGVLRLMGIIIDRGVIEYEVVLFSELAGFINALGNKKLEDLDFSEYNMAWNEFNIQQSWYGFENGAGVVFPLIDYGNVSTNKHDYHYSAFRPALFVKEYLEKIMTAAGYTWTALFLDDPFFKRLIIPNNDKELINKDVINYIHGDNDSLNVDTGFNQGQSIAEINFTNTYTTDFTESGVPVNTFTYSGASTRNISIEFNLNGGYEQEFEFNSGFAVLRNMYSYIVCYKNGVEIGRYQLPVATRPGNVGTGPFLYQGNINATIKVSTQVNTGDTIQFFGITDSDPRSYWDVRMQFIDAVVSLNVSNDPPGYINYIYDDLLNINYTIPKNIFQRDFFTSIMKIFNLMIIESKTKTKHIHIIPNVDFYDLNNILDWSDKVNRDKPIKIKPMSEINARYYNFNYKSDNDYYNDFYKKRWNANYGDRQYDNEMEFATQEKKLEVIFSPSVLVGYPGEDKVVSTILKLNNVGTATQTEEAISHNIRIMQCDRIFDISGYNIFSDIADQANTILTTYGQYLYAGHFNNPDAVSSDLNFGATKELFYNLTTGALQNNIFNAFYSTYMAEITDKDSRLVSCEMYLNEIDIFNLDFRRLIFMDGVLYRLYKVSDWSEGELCKVELLRVINTAYDSNAVHYGYVQICDQIWAKSNLNVTKFRNGDPIPLVTDDTTWSESTAAARCYMNNDSGNAGTIGQLYNWYAATDPRNIAPNGWRVPTLEDRDQLTYCVGYAGGAEKIKSINGWASYPGTNETGFNAFPIGYRSGIDGSFLSVLQADFWLIDEINAALARYIYLTDNNNDLTENFIQKEFGFSIRCIME